MWIYMRGKLMGPLDKWEISIISSKYRNFFIYNCNKKWVHFSKWDKKYTEFANKPFNKPNSFMIEYRFLLHTIKRNLFRDKH